MYLLDISVPAQPSIHYNGCLMYNVDYCTLLLDVKIEKVGRLMKLFILINHIYIYIPMVTLSTACP